MRKLFRPRSASADVIAYTEIHLIREYPYMLHGTLRFALSRFSLTSNLVRHHINWLINPKSPLNRHYKIDSCNRTRSLCTYADKALIWYPVFYQNLRTFCARAEPNLPKGHGYEKIYYIKHLLYRSRGIRFYNSTRHNDSCCDS